MNDIKGVWVESNLRARRHCFHRDIFVIRADNIIPPSGWFPMPSDRALSSQHKVRLYGL